jgi:Ca-activated chloride channel homolog
MSFLRWPTGFSRWCVPLVLVVCACAEKKPEPPPTTRNPPALKVAAAPQPEARAEAPQQAQATSAKNGASIAAPDVTRLAGAGGGKANGLLGDVGGAGLSNPSTGSVGTRGRGVGQGSMGAIAYGSAGLASSSSGTVVQSYPMNFRASGEGESDPPPPSAGGTFKHAGTNPIVDTLEDRLSTFAIDVDTGSWLYTKRFLEMGRAPAQGAVRVEEFVNALHYTYSGPTGEDPFKIHLDAAPSPFTKDHHVVRVALQGKRIDAKERKPTHLTFLVDISGSMASEDKLPWAKEAMHIAVDALRDDDTVAIATYAGGHGLPLGATSVRNKEKIHAAIDTLSSNGGTNMGSGMELAYQEANKHLGGGRTARVMVLSDGDANIGLVSHDQILAKIRGYVSEGVTMSTVGFGTGNYNDHLMEQLADAGNGNYTYIDSKETMRRIFDDELTSTLEVIAQDAKIQVEWNPNVVKTYRLLGYENRDIKDADFRNDKKDAGEIGAGHAVTALYEVRIAGEGSLGTVRVRSKAPRGMKATEVEQAMTSVLSSTDALDADGKAALGMALAAEILRGSTYAEGLTLADAARLLKASASGPYAKERAEAAKLLESIPSSAVASN